MTTVIIDATHQKGIFRPISPVSLSENVQVKVLIQSPGGTVPAEAEHPTLFGAFLELVAIVEDDIAWVKSLWERSIDKRGYAHYKAASDPSWLPPMLQLRTPCFGACKAPRRQSPRSPSNAHQRRSRLHHLEIGEPGMVGCHKMITPGFR